MRLLCNSIRIDPVISTTIPVRVIRLCGACTQPSRSLPNPPPPGLTILPWIFSISAFTMATPDSTMVLGTKPGTRWEAGYGELTISTDWILTFLEFTNSGLSAARRLAHFLSRSIWVTSCRNCPGRLESPVASRSPVGIPTRTINAWRLFPAGYYYGGGLIGQVGPANAIILQPELDLHPTTTLRIYLKALFVWREDTADGLYNTPGNLIRVGSTNNKRYVGASPEILVTQELGRHAILPSLLPFLPGRLPDREPADFKGCRLFFHLADV